MQKMLNDYCMPRSFFITQLPISDANRQGWDKVWCKISYLSHDIMFWRFLGDLESLGIFCHVWTSQFVSKFPQNGYENESESW